MKRAMRCMTGSVNCSRPLRCSFFGRGREPGCILALAFGALLLLLVTAAGVAQPILPPDMRSFSGSPLMLQVVLSDPDRRLRSFTLSCESSTLAYRIPADLDRAEHLFHVSPFFGPGVHDVEVRLDIDEGQSKRTRVQVGFVDFVWGRDNLSFGNNHAYTSVIGTFGEVLGDWIRERFGEIDEADLILLVDYMYSLFGTNTGRCYAFAGTEVRYWRWPDLLPTYFRTAHDLPGSVARHQREMNYLQFDLVFEHFIAHGWFDRLWRPMSREQIHAQALEIEARIAAGEPVAVGFGGPGFHHSMLVFGFIHNPARQTIDLLVANNWKSDEKLNIHSEDAEMVRLFLAPDREGARIEWRYADGLRTSVIDRLITLDVLRDAHIHDRRHLEALLARLRAEFTAQARALVVVEEVVGARLVADGGMAGRLRNRDVRQLDDVWFEYLGRVYRFSYPAGAELELEIEDDVGARLYHITPGALPAIEHAEVTRTAAPPAGLVETRRVGLHR